MGDSMCCSYYANPEHSVMCDPPTNAELIHTHITLDGPLIIHEHYN